MPTPRVLALFLGIVLLTLGVTLQLAPQVWNGQRWLASDTFSKVGLFLVCLWLAWPAAESIRKTPGGAILLVACTAVFGLCLYRPKTLLLTGPFLAVAIAVAYLRRWLARPPKR
ncbi:MAG: hypothetical protein ACK553_10780 [Planctomycetota bacterium]|jgi:hypothetical protein